MKRLAIALAITLALGSLGCIGSLQQIFKDEDVVAMKKLGGLWNVAKFGDAKPIELPERPWTFRRDDPKDKSWYVDLEDQHQRNATLEATFFRVGNETYVETILHRMPANALARLHVLPVHVPSRVVIEKGKLSFYAIHGEATKKLAGKELGWRELGGSGFHGNAFLDADADAWRAVLKKHGKKLFADEPLVVLQRAKVKRH